MTKPRQQQPRMHAVGETTRPETPELEGRIPLPEEITGQASGSDEDLVALFGDDDGEHIADGFRGGSEDEPDATSSERD